MVDEQLGQLFLPHLSSYTMYRSGKGFDEFGPAITKASAMELEKMEKVMDRENRRKRRQTNRSRRVEGPLATESKSKTSRTLLPFPVKFAPKNPTEPSITYCVHCLKNIKVCGFIC